MYKKLQTPSHDTKKFIYIRRLSATAIEATVNRLSISETSSIMNVLTRRPCVLCYDMPPDFHLCRKGNNYVNHTAVKTYTRTSNLIYHYITRSLSLFFSERFLDELLITYFLIVNMKEVVCPCVRSYSCEIESYSILFLRDVPNVFDHGNLMNVLMPLKATLKTEGIC